MSDDRVTTAKAALSAAITSASAQITLLKQTHGLIGILEDELRDKTTRVQWLEGELERETKQRKLLGSELELVGDARGKARQIYKDIKIHSDGGALQLFCPECKSGVGDTRDRDANELDECVKCHSKGPFIYSWETV